MKKLLGSVAGNAGHELLRIIESLASKDRGEITKSIADLSTTLSLINPELPECSIKKLVDYITMYSSIGAGSNCTVKNDGEVCIIIDIPSINEILGG